MNPLSHPSSNYQLLEEIGRGSYSTVHKALKRDERIFVAVKIINVEEMDQDTLQSTLNEVRILFSINSENVVSYFESFLDQSFKQLWIVMEYLTGGDLSGFIRCARQKKVRISENKVWTYAVQILRGLFALNRLGIIHRDVKPANVFLNSNQQTAKLGDLNVSKVTTTDDLARTQIGTPSYLAPEIWENKVYDGRCDIYSLGCVLYELTCLCLPYEAYSVIDLRQKIGRVEIKPLPDFYSANLRNLIFKCLSKNANQRPTAEQWLNSPFILSKIQELNLVEFKGDTPCQLLDTIVVPKELKKLNLSLPKKWNGASVDGVEKQQKRFLQLKECPIESREGTVEISYLVKDKKKDREGFSRMKSMLSLVLVQDDKQVKGKPQTPNSSRVADQMIQNRKLSDFEYGKFSPFEDKKFNNLGFELGNISIGLNNRVRENRIKTENDEKERNSAIKKQAHFEIPQLSCRSKDKPRFFIFPESNPTELKTDLKKIELKQLNIASSDMNINNFESNIFQKTKEDKFAKNKKIEEFQIQKLKKKDSLVFLRPILEAQNNDNYMESKVVHRCRFRALGHQVRNSFEENKDGKNAGIISRVNQNHYESKKMSERIFEKIVKRKTGNLEIGDLMIHPRGNNGPLSDRVGYPYRR